RDIALEVGQVNRHLARILLPLLAGGGSAAAWFAAPAAPVAAAGLGIALAASTAAIAVVAGVGIGVGAASEPASAEEPVPPSIADPNDVPSWTMDPRPAGHAPQQPSTDVPETSPVPGVPEVLAHSGAIVDEVLAPIELGVAIGRDGGTVSVTVELP